MKITNYISFVLLLLGVVNYAHSQDEIMLKDTLFDPEKGIQQDTLQSPGAFLRGDTLLNLNDTTAQTTEKQKSFIDFPINYDAKDSMAVSMEGDQQIVYLYGDATIDYEDINLEADYISVNFNTKEIYATGLKDSTGKVLSKPHFSEGEEEEGKEEFDCESLRYNFVSGKGFVENVITEQEEGFIHGEKTKMINRDEYCIANGKYTTCDAEHPHFYLQMMKGKMIRNKALITGRSYMVLEDFPIYFPFLPYFYVPLQNKTYASGIIVPSYGEESTYGFYLKDGGFYWAASDYFDLKITGDIYSKGKWGVDISSEYKLRYKFSGSISFSYTRSVTGERGIDQEINPNYSLQWSHSQDSKANPNQTLSASVDFSSSGYSKENEYNEVQKYVATSKSSSVSYQRTFSGTPFSMSANIKVSQNTKDSTVSVSLPSLVVTMESIYPFKNKKRAGKERFYEDIKFSYSGQYQSKISTDEDLLFKTPYSDWEKGIKHKTSITLPTFTLFSFVNVVPSVSYNERWYFDYIDEYWIDGYEVTNNATGLQKWVPGHVEEVQKNGFKRNYEYSYSLSSSTTIYGMYTMKNPNSKLVAIRHKMVPTIGFSYHPNFKDVDRFGFWDWVQTDSLGTYEKYNHFEGAMYGSATSGESGSISFSLNNNVEMKLANNTTDTDTTSTEKYKKVAIFSQLNFSGSYNLVADSMNLSTFSIVARTKIAGKTVGVSATLDPYALNLKGSKVNKFMWNEANGISRLGRITKMSFTIPSLSIGSDTFKKKEEDNQGKGAPGQEGQQPENGMGEVGSGMDTPSSGRGEKEGKLLMDSYAPFQPSWNLNVSYKLSYSNSKGNPKWTQTMSMSGSFNPTAKWKTTFNAGYNFQTQKMTQTTMTVTRDLHCWTMSFDFSPFGTTRYYTFTLRANAAMLHDLKLDKNEYFY